jgi:tetratricopeptide (TPR) repeat protein
MERLMKPLPTGWPGWLVALVLVCWFGPVGMAGDPPLTAEQKECLKARGHLLKEVNRLIQEGKHAEAVTAVERQVAREREAFGGAHEKVATSLKLLATVHEIREDFAAARKTRQEVLTMRAGRYGGRHWRVAESRVQLADVDRLALIGREGRARLTQARALEAEAARLRKANRPREALPIARRALALHREVWGEEHPAYAAALHNLAVLHRELKEDGVARALYQQALAVRKRLLGEDHPTYGEGLHELAALCGRAREYDKARGLFERALAVFKEALGEADHSSRVISNNLASLYRLLGEYDKARNLYEHTLALEKRLLGENHPAYATTLYSLANVCRDQGQFREAHALYERALALRKRLLGEESPPYAATLNGLGSLCLRLGDYERARGLLEQALALRRKLLGEDHPDYARSLNNVAALHERLGEYARARELLEHALKVQRRALGEDDPGYASVLHNLAALHHELGDYGKAREMYERVLGVRRKTFGETHPLYLDTLNNLAGLHEQMGDCGKARPDLERALALRRKEHGEAHPAYALALHNLAGLYHATGELAKAGKLYERALVLRKHLLGEEHPDSVSSLHNLAAVRKDLGAHREARELYERAFALEQRWPGETRFRRSATLSSLAMLHRSTGEIPRAARCAHQAFLLRHSLLANGFAAESERGRLIFLGQQRGYLDTYLAFALDAATPPAELYQAVLAWKGALSARTAEERVARQRPELRPLVRRLQTTRAGLAQLAGLTPTGNEAQADWRERFDHLEKAKEGLEILLTQKSAAYQRWRWLRDANLGQVADVLPSETALVDFLQYTHWSPALEQKGPYTLKPRLLASVLVRGREPALVSLGPVEPIDRAVQAWRQAVKGLKPSGPAGAELSRLLWQPLRKHLEGVKTVLIAPDGVVSAFPFAALPGAKPGTYLIEEVAIGYVTSGRHLLELPSAKEVGEAGGLLAVGGLSYGESPADGKASGKPAYRYLPGTRLEVERIAALYRRALHKDPAPRVLRGGAVDVSHFKGQLEPAKDRPRPRYLHLATHGLFEAPSAQVQALHWPRDEALPFELAKEYRAYARNPLLLSGLVLAGANEAPDNGILRAEEVADLDLRGCQLAVLSACDTGLGKVAGGEGVLGLQRAFQAAGARSLVVSLWKVHDAATSVLMEEFYANLWQKKLPRLEALRQAQLTVLRDPARVPRRQKELRAELTRRGLRGPEEEARPLPEGGPRGHPALWAAFVLSGDPGPLPPARAGAGGSR